MQQINSGKQNEKTRDANVKGRSEVSVGAKNTLVGTGVCVGGEAEETGRTMGREVLDEVGYGKTRTIMYDMAGCKAKCEFKFKLEGPMRLR